MTDQPVDPTIEQNGWTLESAEDRHAEHPNTFEIPSRDRRDSIAPGQAAKLLFDIEATEDGRVVDRGIDRMWVLVRSKANDGYFGVLVNNPRRKGKSPVREGDTVFFKPEHVASLDNPPRSYVVEILGDSFFDE